MLPRTSWYTQEFHVIIFSTRHSHIVTIPCTSCTCSAILPNPFRDCVIAFLQLPASFIKFFLWLRDYLLAVTYSLSPSHCITTSISFSEHALIMLQLFSTPHIATLLQFPVLYVLVLPFFPSLSMTVWSPPCSYLLLLSNSFCGYVFVFLQLHTPFLHHIV